MLEKEIEKKVCQKATSLGWFNTKFLSTTRGFPDTIHFRKGITVCIEFKRNGGRLSALQKKRISKLRECGIPTFVIWNVEQGFELLSTLEGLQTTEAVFNVNIGVEDWME